jgi:hypothetical protein
MNDGKTVNELSIQSSVVIEIKDIIRRGFTERIFPIN